MTKTTNYNLNQWDADDPVVRTDFNEDNAKLDAALAAKANAAAVEALQAAVTGKAESSALSALQAVVTGKGNCRVEFGTYVGTGNQYDTVSLTTSFSPKMIIVYNGLLSVMFRGATYAAVFRGNSSRAVQLTWREDGVSWRLSNGDESAQDILNGTETHYYAAFG